MHTKALVSAIALIAAVGFTPVVAQETMERTMNGQVITGGPALLIESQCDVLAQRESTDDQTDENEPADANGQADDSDEGDAPAALEAMGITLDSITLASCEEGGWLDAAASTDAGAMAPSTMEAAPAAMGAERTMNGQVITGGAALLIESQCDVLAQRESTDDQTDENETADANGQADDSDEGDAPAALEAMGITLDSITLASCEEGGWLN